MDDDAPGPWWKRIGWMILIWTGSVMALAIVAFAIRSWLVP